MIRDPILYETAGHYVRRAAKGFEVYRMTATAAERVARIGDMDRAKAECDRRETELASAINEKRVKTVFGRLCRA